MSKITRLDYYQNIKLWVVFGYWPHIGFKVAGIYSEEEKADGLVAELNALKECRGVANKQHVFAHLIPDIFFEERTAAIGAPLNKIVSAYNAMTGAAATLRQLVTMIIKSGQANIDTAPSFDNRLMKAREEVDHLLDLLGDKEDACKRLRAVYDLLDSYLEGEIDV